MKYLQEIRLTQFKNYFLNDFHFNQKLIAIIGKNGSGKTNLLDAIYYLCFTKSYFQSREVFNIMQGKDGLRLEGRFINRDNQQTENIVCVIKDGKKSISKDEVYYEKLSQHIGHYCAVMIAPDDIKIINEGGEFRRKFFDGLIAQLNPTYLDSLLQYHKVNTQKNAYLKQTPHFQISRDLVQVYNDQLIPLGSRIVTERQEMTEILKPYILDLYHQLSSSTEHIDIQYLPSISTDKWAETLQQNIHREIENRRVLQGAHLDDWALNLDSFSFKAQASQGQKKSLLIALKIAQVKILDAANKTPILLLDDIFEKLDRQRTEILFKLLHQMDLAQIILTHTYQQDIEDQVRDIFKEIQYIQL